MTSLAFGRMSFLAAVAAAFEILAAIAAPTGASGQALRQVEQDLRRQVGPPESAAGSPEAPSAAPGYLGLFADDRNLQGRGLRVLEVMKGGPADKAGIEAGDLITSVNGATMRTLDDMAHTLGPLPAGRRADFQVLRAGVALQLFVTLGVRPERTDPRAPRFGRQSDELPGPSDAGPTGAGASVVGAGGATPGAINPGGGPLLGVRTVMLDGERRGLYKIPASVFGALVTAVVSGSAADRIGLQPGMLITSFEGQPVDSPQTLAGLVRAAGPGRQVEIGFRDQNGESHRQVTTTGLGSPADPSAAMIPHPALGPNGDMPSEIGLPQEIPPGPGLFPWNEPGGKPGQIDALEKRVEALESRIQKLEAALQSPAKP